MPKTFLEIFNEWFTAKNPVTRWSLKVAVQDRIERDNMYKATFYMHNLAPEQEVVVWR